MQTIEAIPLFKTRSTGGSAATAAKTAPAPQATPAPAAPMLWDLPAFDAPPAAVSNPAYDAPVTAAMLSNADLDPQDPTMLAHYKHYVGKIVSDAQMTDLYLAAHRNGFKLTSEAQGAWWQECDYKVTGCYG